MLPHALLLRRFAWETDDRDAARAGAEASSSTAALRPRAGSVVQLRARTRRLSLRSVAGAGPAVVISSAPSVAGNMPQNATRAEVEGGLIVLVGQVRLK